MPISETKCPARHCNVEDFFEEKLKKWTWCAKNINMEKVLFSSLHELTLNEKLNSLLKWSKT